MKVIKLNSKQLRRLLIKGEVIIKAAKIECEMEFKFPKEIFELLETRRCIDENIMNFYRRNKHEI